MNTGRRNVIFISLVLIIVTGFAVFAYRKNYLAGQKSSGVEIIPTTVIQQYETWIDQSEFEIQYPKELILNTHEEDQENYAHLEFTSPTHPGNLIVWAKDTTSENIDSWLKQNNITNVLDSFMGQEPAKKVFDQTNSQKILLSSIREGFLYQIEADLKDREYWSKIYDQISSSFIFTVPQDRSDKAPVSGENNSLDYTEADIWEGEELIE